MSKLTMEEYNSLLEAYQGLTFQQMAETILQLKESIASADTELKKLKETLEILTLKVVPDKLDDEGMSSINIRGIGRLGVTLDMHVNVPAANRPEWFEWLETNGHGGLIKRDPDVNASTQKAFIKECVRNAEELPSFVKADPFYRASVTKK